MKGVRKILEYWKPLKDKNGYVYSCDMVRLSLEFRRDELKEINGYLERPDRVDIKSYPQNLTEFKYRYMYSIDYGRSTLILGLGFNGCKREDSVKGFIEYNPNKCMGNPQCENDLQYLLSRTVAYEVVRYDLAIDIPYDRENVHMIKDNRKFSLEMKSYASRTEYLGQRNTPGRIKVYNKTVESDLDYSLTRVEVTMGGLENVPGQFEQYMPTIWVDEPQKSFTDLDELSNSQQVMVNLLKDIANPEYYLKQLNYHMRKKIEPYIMGDNAQLSFDTKQVFCIVANLRDLFKSCALY